MDPGSSGGGGGEQHKRGGIDLFGADFVVDPCSGSVGVMVEVVVVVSCCWWS